MGIAAMIDIPLSIDMYSNTQVYFAQNILNNLPNDDHEWALGYRNWLLEQGCELIVNPYNLKNSLGVSPGYDTFRFSREQDAIAFVLRWA